MAIGHRPVASTEKEEKGYICITKLVDFNESKYQGHKLVAFRSADESDSGDSLSKAISQ